MLRIAYTTWLYAGRRAALIGAVGITALALTACQRSASEDGGRVASRPPPQAGQPLNPVAVAGRILAARGAALRGDQPAAEANIQGFVDDFRKSIKLADVTKPVDHEAARAAVRPLAGVRSSVWMDQSNLIVMVDGTKYRTMETIDRVCNALAPLGDTLGVVVNVQNVAARNSHEADTLSRNCQLPQGERALMQPKRKIDALDPETRREFEAQQGGQGR